METHPPTPRTPISAFSTNRNSRYPSLQLSSTPSNHRRKKEKDPSKYDGRSDLSDYLYHFAKIAKRNDWTYEDCGLELATSLIGEAREILSCAPIEYEDDYDSLVGALSTRFDPEGKESKYSAELMQRTCQPKEEVAAYGHQLQRLVRKAYPLNNLPDRVLIDLFIRGLPTEEMKRHVSSFEPPTFAEAVRRATLCEVYDARRLNKKPSPAPECVIAPVGKPRDNIPPQGQPNPQYPNPPPPSQPYSQPPPQNQYHGNQNANSNQFGNSAPARHPPRPRAEVTCYLCQQLGHYANECHLSKSNSYQGPPHSQPRPPPLIPPCQG